MIFTCCCCFCCCCCCCGKCGGSENEDNVHCVDPDELEAEMSEEQNRGNDTVITGQPIPSPAPGNSGDTVIVGMPIPKSSDGDTSVLITPDVHVAHE
ncbi:dnaJ homolog subfamily C member 5-like [Sinocyclocheilus grahami]|uniref:dnaJ homolog subfamily C member 5-like n=1 Tax=Sinocyclocheilus grahami TaxID=75366 RepID=UPI0007ACEB5C|nr:PREDICTED: dnaJ homolog subfamily C member 5-like [Sinocyclocheilus grahami]